VRLVVNAFCLCSIVQFIFTIKIITYSESENYANERLIWQGWCLAERNYQHPFSCPSLKSCGYGRGWRLWLYVLLCKCYHRRLPSEISLTQSPFSVSPFINASCGVRSTHRQPSNCGDAMAAGVKCKGVFPHTRQRHRPRRQARRRKRRQTRRSLRSFKNQDSIRFHDVLKAQRARRSH